MDIHSEENCYIPPYYDHSRTNYFDLSTLELHNIVWIFSGMSVVLACLISFWSVYKHLSNYTKPNYQKHIIRIILMVPIYGIDSFFSLRFYWLSVYFDVIRDCYEAFVIYTFYSLLIEYIGGYNDGKTLCASRERFKLSFPLCCITMTPTRGLLRQCKRLTLQYVIIRPVMTILAIVLHSFRLYCPGNISPLKGYFYITFTNFCSVTIAMYALVLFYSIIKHDIAQFKPIPKFLSVKFVIFLSFWQSVAVTLFVAIHGINPTKFWTTDDISTAFQNALLCGEMLVAAIWHLTAFSYKDFQNETRTPVFKSARDTFNVHDIALDVYYSFYPLRKKANIQQELLENRRSMTARIEEGEDCESDSNSNSNFSNFAISDSEIDTEFSNFSNSNFEEASIVLHASQDNE